MRERMQHIFGEKWTDVYLLYLSAEHSCISFHVQYELHYLKQIVEMLMRTEQSICLNCVLATIVVIIFVAIDAVYNGRRRRRCLRIHKMDWDMCETCPSLIGIDMSTKWASSYLESSKTTSLPQAMPFATKCVSAVSSNFHSHHLFKSSQLRSFHPPNVCQVRASPFFVWSICDHHHHHYTHWSFIIFHICECICRTTANYRMRTSSTVYSVHVVVYGRRICHRKLKHWRFYYFETNYG